MKGYVPGYDLYQPKNLADALEQVPKMTPFAGGTDLMVQFEVGKLPQGTYLNIWKLDELRGISVTPEWISLGALTTYAELRALSELRAEFPMLVQAASETGSMAIQNRGTLGGNIVNASPAADSPPALLVYEAELEFVSSSGTRRISYLNFHQGYKKMDLLKGELLSKIHLPRQTKGWTQHYHKVGTRKAQAISKVCLAVMKKGSDLRIAMGSVAPIPIRCVQTETAYKKGGVDAAVKALATEIHPIDDIRSVREYRQRVAQNLLRHYLERP